MTTPGTQQKVLLGEHLIAAGLIDQDKLDQALAHQERMGGYIGETLVSLGYISSESLSRALADAVSLTLIDLSHKIRLGERLLRAGHINEAQLSLGLREQQRLGGYLGETLINLGFITSDTLTEALAEESAVNVIDLQNTLIDDELIKLIPYEMAKRFRLVPLNNDNGHLTIAMADTFNVIAIDTVSKISGMIVDVVGAPEDQILELLDHHYAQGMSIEETVDLILRQGITAEGDAEESPMVRLVDQIIVLAVKNNATDIHIEPEEKTLRVRMRMDGILHKMVLMPTQLFPALSSRVKIMSGLDVTERRIPQDGRASFKFGGRPVDLRVSTLPSACGENIVIRVLDRNPKKMSLEDLGMSEHDYKVFSSLVQRPHGIILVTGPTGSGKTTTLYTALSKIDAVEKSVFTLEDPIEYMLPMIRQTQVNLDVGLNFAEGLRSILRQDPDVILVGEIRDQETASLAVRSALTGHLVLSTLHTNDAAGAIPRLIDMGVDSYLIPACLIGVVAQRLVRKICNDCKEEVNPPQTILDRFSLTPEEQQHVRFFNGKGCSKCNGTGYKGRVAIYEIMQMSDTFHDSIVKNQRLTIEEVNASGMRRMFTDGVEKMSSGLTSIEEVLRVVISDA
ncbi:general secretion pathway protein E [Mariprofundus micogutta]|uniref:General secretion pathway protein E n=1 Tax=Mariprofundus micogutta TaxID=1921010 RepID=A0A1L8CP90_9PROT|nr:GspE/PulE family protein [Mariprofundus micogutta]GAV20728.1 general secretion pathway protein E [Mariprofundus micogutta]